MFFSFCQRGCFFVCDLLAGFVPSSQGRTQEPIFFGSVVAQRCLRADGQPGGDFALWKALGHEWTGSEASSAKQIAPNWDRLRILFHKDSFSAVVRFWTQPLSPCCGCSFLSLHCSLLSSSCNLCMAAGWPSKGIDLNLKRKKAQNPLLKFFFFFFFFISAQFPNPYLSCRNKS